MTSHGKITVRGKTTDFFTMEKLRTFLQWKNYVLFYNGKTTDFFT